MRSFSLMFVATLMACGGAAPEPKTAIAGIPVPEAPRTELSKPVDSSEGAKKPSPPASLQARPFAFPKVKRQKTGGGLDVAHIENHALPIVQIRLAVRAGAGYGEMPGLAHFAVKMLKDGGTRTMTSAQLLERLEALGANLNVDASFDASVLSVGVLRDHVDEVLKILAEMVTAPRFDEGEFRKLKTRELDGARDRARSSGSWMAMGALFRELYADKSPYAHYDLTPASIGAVTLPKVKDFHRRFFVPKNASLVLAGDLTAEQAQSAAERAFGTWKGGEAPTVEFPPTIVPAKTHVVLADRPKSAQSDIYLVQMAPPRSASSYPVVRVVNQVLGGGVASRLFLDIREQRSLAYGTRSSLVELAQGPQPLLAYAGTQTPKTGLAVAGLLENLERLKKASITSDEAESARRFLSDIFAVRVETIGAIADLLVQQTILRLPDGYWDAYRAAVRDVSAEQANAEAAKLMAPDRVLIVVAGDADRLATPLSHFGDVVVVDPENEFQTKRTVPMNPAAAIELTKP